MPASREAVPCPFIIQFKKGVTKCLWVSRLNCRGSNQYDALCIDKDQNDYMTWGPPATGHPPNTDWVIARTTIVVFDQGDAEAQASRCPCVNIHALGLRYGG